MRLGVGLSPCLPQQTSGGGAPPAPAPTVSSVTPTTSPLAGRSIVIAGTGFLAGATVDVGGTPATAVVVDSAIQITCTAPAKGAGAHAIRVTNSDTQFGELAAALTYQAAPAVSSVTPSTSSSLGGATIVIAGTGFLAGAIPTIDGTACTGIVVDSAIQITCVTPAKAAAAYTLRVTNTDTQFGELAGAVTYYTDPSTLALTGWWRASYTASPWVGTASAGASGGRNVANANAPSTGTAINGRTPALFDGVNDMLASTTLAVDFTPAAEGFVAILVKVNTTAAAGTAANFHNDESPFGSSLGRLGIGTTNSGARAGFYNGSVRSATAFVACSTGTWHWLFAWWSGGTMNFQVDGGAPVSIAMGGTGTVVFAGDVLRLGQCFAGFYDGQTADAMTMATAPTAGVLTNLITYGNSYHGLSIT